MKKENLKLQETDIKKNSSVVKTILLTSVGVAATMLIRKMISDPKKDFSRRKI